MAEPFVGEIRLFAANFAPKNWAFCDGRVLPIADHQALYSVLGTGYGGDGAKTFGLPDLRGRMIVHPGAVADRGQVGGQEEVALTVQEIPAHIHHGYASTANATTADPTGHVLAKTSQRSYSGTETRLNELAPQSVASAGKGHAHENMQPTLVLNYIIALTGIYPPRK